MEYRKAPIEPVPVANLPDLCALSIWTPNQLQHERVTSGGCSVPQQRLIEAGLLNYGDLIAQNGSIRQWPYPRESVSERSNARAYDTIITNLDAAALPHQSSRAWCNVYVSSGIIQQGSEIWSYKLRR